MDCTEFEERWLERLDRGPGDSDAEATAGKQEGARRGDPDIRPEAAAEGVGTPDPLAAHLSGCRRCRELVALLDAGERAVELPADLLGEILSRTSGRACDRARLLLAGRFGARRDDAGTPLRAHLVDCPECSALANTLEGLARDLPALAEIAPDAGFVEEVLAATLPGAAASARERARGATPAATASARRPGSGPAPEAVTSARKRPSGPAPAAGFWARLLGRPRLALEGAFLATLACVSIFGLPSSSAAELPGRLLEEVRRERIETTVKLQRLTAAQWQELATGARQRWTATSGRIDTWLTSSTGPLDAVRLWAGRWLDALVRLVDELRRPTAPSNDVSDAAGEAGGPEHEDESPPRRRR